MVTIKMSDAGDIFLFSTYIKDQYHNAYDYTITSEI